MPSILSKTSTAAVAAFAGAALAVTGLSAGPAAAASSTAAAPAGASDLKVARWGAAYLAAQITPAQPYIAPFGGPDLGSTAQTVVGLHAAGVGGKASDLAVAWLKTQVATGMAGSDGNDDPGRLGFTILAAVTAGQDPRHFGGTAAANDLVARLLATSTAGGNDAGLFGTAPPAFDGSFRQGTALAALKAANVSKAQVSANIAWLTGQQCANGFWTSYRADTSVACPAADPNTFAGPDTNSTGLAVEGLAAYSSVSRKTQLLNTFKSIQSSDGGFPFLAATRQTSDPNSTALSIQGLLGAGVAKSLPGYRKGGRSPYDALAAYQLGCDSPAADRGAFTFPGIPGPNVFATVQSVPAMAKSVVPLGASTPRPNAPAMPCAAPALAKSAPALARSAPALAKTTAALAGTAGACPTKTKGVTVAVDFTAFPGGTMQVRCAPGTPTTGVAALQQAGFTPAGTAAYGLAFICRINNLPSTSQQACLTTPPANAYWAYYHANKGATAWTYSPTGASSYRPAQGSIEAWAFGNAAKPSKTPAKVRKTTA